MGIAFGIARRLPVHRTLRIFKLPILRGSRTFHRCIL